MAAQCEKQSYMDVLYYLGEKIPIQTRANYDFGWELLRFAPIETVCTYFR